MKYVPLFQAAIAAGFHLFPFRTEKLSPPAPMVLPARRESRSPPSFFEREPPCKDVARGLLVFWWEGEQSEDSEDSEYSEFPEKMKTPEIQRLSVISGVCGSLFLVAFVAPLVEYGSPVFVYELYGTWLVLVVVFLVSFFATDVGFDGGTCFFPARDA